MERFIIVNLNKSFSIFCLVGGPRLRDERCVLELRLVIDAQAKLGVVGEDGVPAGGLLASDVSVRHELLVSRLSQVRLEWGKVHHGDDLYKNN